MSYNIIKILHLLFAIIAIGPLLFSPWLSYRLKTATNDTKQILLQGLSIIDKYYNIAGWFLIISGIIMFYIYNWNRLFELWFITSVLLFIIDSISEKKLRDPTNQILMQLHTNNNEWQTFSIKLHYSILLQMVCNIMIFINMLLYSQFHINSFNILSLIGLVANLEGF